MAMTALLIATVVSVFFLFRTILVLVGYYKVPVLNALETYGPVEKLYLPLLPLTAWSGALAFLSGLWLGRHTMAAYVMATLGVLLLLAAGFGYNSYETISRYHFRLLPYPRWYYNLLDRTTRYERRRIAYMWLSLPWRLRLTLNSSDHLFDIWADYVILGTVREEEDEYKPERDEGYTFTRDWADA